MSHLSATWTQPTSRNVKSGVYPEKKIENANWNGVVELIDPLSHSGTHPLSVSLPLSLSLSLSLSLWTLSLS